MTDQQAVGGSFICVPRSNHLLHHRPATPLLHPTLLFASDSIAADNVEPSTRQCITYFPITGPAVASAEVDARMGSSLGGPGSDALPDILFGPALDATSESKHPFHTAVAPC